MNIAINVHGSGMYKKQIELEVEIPAGVDDKNIIVIKGKGEIRKKWRTRPETQKQLYLLRMIEYMQEKVMIYI